MTTAQKLARATLVVVCAGVLLAIVAIIIRSYQSDSTSALVAKFVILILWFWASWRLINRVLHQ
ncbi:MAG: hypothetical protein MR215_06890 [Bacteroidales bacterium]|nr:hypothetical protein [Bacteroidales bacterium]MDD7726196.1 hypothetical protein [Bacteroidales bacterium]MDY4175434.1 hypothetical protein [Bacteroidales bacterium]